MVPSKPSGDAEGRTRMRTGLPRGSRDLMPAAFRRRRALTTALVDVFERWGYAPVMTPLLEYYDVLGRGLTETDRRLCVRFIEAGSGDLVALRSDMTPQIARMVAQRAGGELDVGVARRLCYAADVVRQARGDREQTEYHQAGVELIGDADAAADAELIALCDEALRDAGLDGFRIDLAHARVGHDLITSLGLSGPANERLRRLLARKDRGGVEELLRSHDCTGRLATAAAALCNLFGPPTILEQARAALVHCEVDAGLDRLEAVLAHLRADDESIASRITVDLGEVRGFEYYTGLRLRVWAPGVGRPVARGGRYDDLLGRYGFSAPATGFAIDLDALETALQHAGHSPRGAVPNPAHVIAVMAVMADESASDARRRAATRLARQARAGGRRAWTVMAAGIERAQAQADAAGAEMLTTVAGTSQALEIDEYERTPRGWIEKPERVR